VNSVDSIPLLPEGTLLLLFQSARELLFNTVKHAGVRTARISIFKDDTFIIVQIEDEGRGFEPGRLRAAGKPAGGIGLFGIQERLTHIGGRFEIESAQGEGSRFRLFVPTSEAKAKELLIPEMRPDGSSAAHPESNNPDTHKTRIMLVDDHLVVRQGLAGIMRSVSDFEIAAEASDGESAIRIARDAKPDVILMDISMPGMDGIQAARIIHSENPDICIIGLSGFYNEEQKRSMYEAGAADYLSKSGPSQNLIEAIKSFVGRPNISPEAQEVQRDSAL
jgi:CheY-like chemotaxis protein